MKTINLPQKGKEWLQFRKDRRGASEAPAMMNLSKYVKRSELLKEKATGIAKDISPATQALFDQGHAAEEAIRPHIEELIGDDLYNVTGELEDTKIMASFDGLTLMSDIVFEHKLWNQKLAADIAEGNLEEHYKIQMDQQLLVSGAKRAIFVCSDGTPEKMVYMWYETTEERKQAIIDGWAQFEKDLESFEVKEPVIEAKGEFIPSLPTLRVQINGQVTDSNLATYKQTALAFIGNINTNLSTDQDFANAEETVKFCKKAEKELAQVKQNALAQTASIDDLFRTVDDLSEAMRQKRLELDKLVKTRKEAIKISIAANGKEKLNNLWLELVSGLPCVPQFCPVNIDISGAMKGKKTISSLQDAADSEVARASIEATKIAEQFKSNMSVYDAEAPGFEFLFNDLSDLIYKPTEDFKTLVLLRVSEHKAEQERRLQAERERIANEERIKQERIASEKIRKLEEEQRLAQMKKDFYEKTEQPKPENKVERQIKPQETWDLMADLKAWAKAKGLSLGHVEELKAILIKHGFKLAA